MDRNKLLAKAVLNTAKKLSLDIDQLTRVLGIDNTPTLQLTALDPDSKQGERAIIWIRIFRLLYELNGGDMQWIRLYMNSQNHLTGGIPLQQIQQENGLIKVLESLERVSPNQKYRKLEIQKYILAYDSYRVVNKRQFADFMITIQSF